MSELESSRDSSLVDTAAHTPQESGNDASGGGVACENRLCDTFLDRFATMMDHENMAKILAEQEHMYVYH